jgi:GNAT superfamily N-acetyltransferase
MHKSMLWMRISTTFYRRATLMVRDLASVEPNSPQGPARIAQLRREDLGAYGQFRPETPVAQLERRLARGDAAFVAWVGNRIVHAAWVAAGRAYVAYQHRDLLLQPDELLMYDSYTLPEYRESGIARARMMHVFREYGARGYRRFVGVVAEENVIGRHAIESTGYRAAARYACVRLGGWSRCWRVSTSDTHTPELAAPQAS